MWSDDETTDDLFGFRVHADLIRELIMDPTVLPAAIGVYGDWRQWSVNLAEAVESVANNFNRIVQPLRLDKGGRV